MPARKPAKPGKATKIMPKTLSVSSSPGAPLKQIIRDVELALGKVGCRGCRSGIDKIIIGDLVTKGIK